MAGPDWGRRSVDRFRFVRVTWPGLAEAGELDGITGGPVTDSLGDSVKSSGSLDYAADPGVGNDLVRVYCDSSWDDGTMVTTALGTYLWCTPEGSLRPGRRSGTADLYSTLKVLEDWGERAPYSLAAGSNAVGVAKAICEACGLPVSATPSGVTLSTPHAWDAGTSRLEIVNWLLDFAGYGSAGVDGYGTVVMEPYADPSSKAPAATLADDGDGCFEAEVGLSRDDWDTPNVVVVTCESSERTVSAFAVDQSGTRYSVDSRCREVTRTETLGDIDSGSTDNEVEAACLAKAELLLATGRQSVEKARVRHYYKPFSIGDAVEFRYTSAGYSQKMGVWSREVSLTPGMACSTLLRRFTDE